MSSSQNMWSAYASCYIANMESLSISWMSDLVSFSHLNMLLYILKNHKPCVTCKWLDADCVAFIYLQPTICMSDLLLKL